MFKVGRLCLKTAGRDAGKKCVVVDVLEKNLVLVDGETRRRKCNIMHLEPLKDVVSIKKGASHDEVKRTLEPLGFKIIETKPKKKTERPKKKLRVKKQRATPAKAKPAPKKVEKPQEKAQE